MICLYSIIYKEILIPKSQRPDVNKPSEVAALEPRGRWYLDVTPSGNGLMGRRCGFGAESPAFALLHRAKMETSEFV